MHPIITNALEGRSAIGCFLSEIAAPNILRIYRASGVEFVIVDCEHGAFDYSQVAALAAVGNGIGLPVLVRIPCVAREHVQKYLDAGADGLLVPMISTADSAREAVQYAKYAPLGRRGASTMRPHSEYNPGKLSEYMAKANGRTMVFVQIETQEGVQNALDIARVDGLDGLFVGPNDLSIDYGAPGDFHTPAMEEAVKKVIGSASQAGKPSGVIASDMAYLHWCQALGMRLFSCNSEVGLLAQRTKSMVTEFKDIKK